MDKIRSVIVDDEKNSLLIIRKLLERHLPEVEVVDTAQSVSEAIEKIRKHKPDLVFLDISMPDGDGFDVIEALPDEDFKVIFITAYDNYAIRAFDFAALHYLLKPVKPDDLKEAVERFKQEKNSENELLPEQMEIVKDVLNQNTDIRRLMLSTSTGLHLIDLDDIIHCESSNNYTTFYLKDGEKIIVSKSIQLYEKLLAPYHFCRVHNKHIVNLKYVKRVVKSRGGFVELTNGEKIDISEGRKKNLLEKLKQFSIGH